MRLVSFAVAGLILVGCNGAAAPASTPVSTPAATTASPSVPEDTAAASLGAASPAASANAIIGEWVRTAGCAEALTAFTQAGLADQVPDWVVGNFVAEGSSPAPGKECADAKAAVPHSHFFTANGQFGSRDENGQDVDSGDYQVVDPDTLSFRTHAQEFGYAGDLFLDFSIAGNEATFSVTVPTPCVGRCRVAYGWAMSAFFGSRPFKRK